LKSEKVIGSDRFGVYVVKQQDSPPTAGNYTGSLRQASEAILTFLTVETPLGRGERSKRKEAFPQS